MKKTLLLLFLAVGTIFGASAQCTPDTTHFGGGTYVYPASLDTIHAGQPFTGTISIEVPDSLPYSLLGQSVTGYVDSIRIDSITGDPSGITSQSNPALGVWIQHGRYACATFSGTTSAPTADYPLTISGRACGHITVPVYGLFDTCTAYNFNRSYPYKLTVINPSGIADIAKDINLNIYPNPNQGTFTVAIASPDHLVGSIAVVDQLGRVMSTQPLDVYGNKLIPVSMSNLSSGSYLLEINTQNGKSIKQFSVK